MTGSEVSFGEENGIPRLLLILKKVNPQPIVRHDEFPRLTNRAQLSRLLWAEEFQYLSRYVQRNPVEVAGWWRLQVHHLLEPIIGQRERIVWARTRARTVGDGLPDFSEQVGHRLLDFGWRAMIVGHAAFGRMTESAEAGRNWTGRIGKDTELNYLFDLVTRGSSSAIRPVSVGWARIARACSFFNLSKIFWWNLVSNSSSKHNSWWWIRFNYYYYYYYRSSYLQCHISQCVSLINNAKWYLLISNTGLTPKNITL